MSCVYKGKIIDTNLSKNARGGTEMMRERLLRYVPSSLLENFAIHISRPRNIYNDVKNIMWAHDLSEDPENKILLNGGWKIFDKFVFVSYWQRDQYIKTFGIPYSKCTVIENAIECYYDGPKPSNKIHFIYHTTPHRGLEILYPVFDALSKKFDNIHLDVFSSFKVYGWEQRDEPYKKLFDDLNKHNNITYHGAKDNSDVLKALEHSHIFVYPSIWQETSCIAMIEALRTGCLVVHPTLAALPETASNSTVMYDYTEDKNEHANKFYSILHQLLTLEENRPGSIAEYAKARSQYNSYFGSKHNVEHFGTKWKHLLIELMNDK